MRFQQLLDSIPIVGVFVAFAIVALITSEIGYRHGRWWQGHTPDEREGPTAMIVGSLLALMAFLLAITMGIGADRFGMLRRALVLAEANSVGLPRTSGPATCQTRPSRPGTCSASKCPCAS